MYLYSIQHVILCMSNRGNVLHLYVETFHLLYSSYAGMKYEYCYKIIFFSLK